MYKALKVGDRVRFRNAADYVLLSGIPIWAVFELERIQESNVITGESMAFIRLLDGHAATDEVALVPLRCLSIQ